MEEDGNIIAGVGDEVVLFILFLVISILLIFYLSRRRGNNYINCCTLSNFVKRKKSRGS